MKVTYAKDIDHAPRIPVALKVWDAIQKIAPKSLSVTIRPYDNGREQGYCLTAADKTVSFAENRNSDDIVVLTGRTKDFDECGVPTEAVYRKAQYLGWSEIEKAAKEIITHLL